MEDYFKIALSIILKLLTKSRWAWVFFILFYTGLTVFGQDSVSTTLVQISGSIIAQNFSSTYLLSQNFARGSVKSVSLTGLYFSNSQYNSFPQFSIEFRDWSKDNIKYDRPGVDSILRTDMLKVSNEIDSLNRIRNLTKLKVVRGQILSNDSIQAEMDKLNGTIDSLSQVNQSLKMKERQLIRDYPSLPDANDFANFKKLEGFSLGGLNRKYSVLMPVIRANGLATAFRVNKKLTVDVGAGILGEQFLALNPNFVSETPKPKTKDLNYLIYTDFHFNEATCISSDILLTDQVPRLVAQVKRMGEYFDSSKYSINLGINTLLQGRSELNEEGLLFFDFKSDLSEKVAVFGRFQNDLDFNNSVSNIRVLGIEGNSRSEQKDSSEISMNSVNYRFSWSEFKGFNIIQAHFGNNVSINKEKWFLQMFLTGMNTAKIGKVAIRNFNSVSYNIRTGLARFKKVELEFGGSVGVNSVSKSYGRIMNYFVTETYRLGIVFLIENVRIIPEVQYYQRSSANNKSGGFILGGTSSIFLFKRLNLLWSGRHENIAGLVRYSSSIGVAIGGKRGSINLQIAANKVGMTSFYSGNFGINFKIVNK